MSAARWNVDNYHWEEHNANVWAKARLDELVKEIAVDGWEFSEYNFSSIDAHRSIRKGKEIRSYEIIFDVNFKFNEMEGKISFPDISYDAAESPDEWDVDVKFTGKSDDKPANDKKVVRTACNKDVIPKFRAAFAQWVSEFQAIPYELGAIPASK